MKIEKNYHEESNNGYFLAVDVQYPETLHELHHGLPFYFFKIEKIQKTYY